MYLFYRKKMNVKKPSSIDDIQRLHMILVPDNHFKKRLFVVGKKRLPKIAKSKAKSTQREWALNVLSTTKETDIRDALIPMEYETKTKGTRIQPGSVPVAQGKYQINKEEHSTKLGFKLTEPKNLGKAQKELGIKKEATYVISVKNPDVKTPKYIDEKPNYPKTLQKKFADKRWIDVDDKRLLDYENTQILLIGADDSLEDFSPKITGTANVFKKLKVDKKLWPVETLQTGKFTRKAHKREPGTPEKDRTKGGRRGGKVAVNTVSAAGIAKSLKGIDFPAKKKDVVSYAKEHYANQKIVDTLKQLSSKTFNTMADIQKAVGEVR